MSARPTPLSTRAIVLLLMALALYGMALAWIQAPLDLAQYRALFSEKGPFERLSPPFWLLLAITGFLAAWRLPKPASWNLAMVSCVPVLFAMREADWHYKLVGENVLRVKFYVHGVAATHVKLIAGVVVALGLAVLIRTLMLGVRHLRSRGAFSQTWTWSLLIGFTALIGTKVLDRSINLAAEWFGWRFDESVGHLIGAFEEGYECALPLIFLVALVQYLIVQPDRVASSVSRPLAAARHGAGSAPPPVAMRSN